MSTPTTEQLLNDGRASAQQMMEASHLIAPLDLTTRAVIEDMLVRQYIKGGRAAIAPVAKRLGIR